MPTPKLQQAIDALNAGRRSDARELLMAILADNLRNVDALLWMAAASETSGERYKWLNRVLEVDPHNKHAIRALGVLDSTYQPSPEQKPVTEHTLVDQPSPGWKPVVEQPTLQNGQATGKKKSGSMTRIVLLLVAIVIGAVLVNNYMQAKAALDRYNRECDGIVEWLQELRDRTAQGQQIAKQISQVTGSTATMVQALRDESDKTANLEAEQESSQPPIAARALNSKLVQAFHMYSVGLRMGAEGIETNNNTTALSGLSMVNQGTDLLHEANTLMDSVVEQCK